ncbi:Hpt domain-containing protein [Acinetobacter pittii]|uniref:hybrid sensor histidine kinase/response regulator n=1 Tax=Acinetobacter TaxID=469 RepID=UPI00070779A9|nr:MULTISPECIES: hybrid sensor histidine kinase/response regulator [Acinetobacter]AVZ03763.1 response regulator [Acinetobacter pittii]KQE06835.1 two-component system sensor histidine kinase/response regulator [Acinetobacter pittii]MBN6510646.1 Hpt domain-containing protein [Acinetobacter pittii]MBT1523077.1 Hpt domain-containing protein [Acinetobacter pittii]MCH2011324.1 Hpt domain-containing protein [Acinetobacter pittii]
MKEILKTLTEAMMLPEDSYSQQDDEFLEIFVEEIEEIFVELQSLIHEWMQSENVATLTEIRRHFHTLKGSGRMIGAKSSAELAWTVEDTLNRVINQSLGLTPNIQQYVQLVFKFYFFKLVDDFKSKKNHTLDFRPLILLGQQLQQQQSIEPALDELLLLSDILTAETQTGLETNDLEPESTEVLTISTSEVAIETEQTLAETLILFMEEAEEHLATIDQFLEKEIHQHESYNALIRALHTLRGSSAMAHVEPIFDASTKVEHLFKILLQEELSSHSEEISLLRDYRQFIRNSLDLLAAHCSTEQLESDLQKFNQVWDAYMEQHGEHSSPLMPPHGLVSQLLQLDVAELLDAELDFEKGIRTEFPHYLERLSEQADVLLQHTQSQAMIGLYEYTNQLKESYDILLDRPDLLQSDYVFEIYQKAHQQLIQLFDALAAGQRVSIIEQHQNVLDELKLYTQYIPNLNSESLETHQDVFEPLFNAEVEQTANEPLIENVFTDQVTIGQSVQLDRQFISSEHVNRHFDPDLLDIFLEEADELLEGMDTDLNLWVNDQENFAALNNLMRYLHTLKGGANMIQATYIGLIAHELESIYERLIQKQLVASSALIDFIRLVQDDLADRLQIVREQHLDYAASHTIQALKNAGQVFDSHIKESKTESETYVIPELNFEVLQQEAINNTALNLSELTSASEQIAESSNQLVEQTELQVLYADHNHTESIPDQDINTVVEQTFMEEAAELLEMADHLLKQWFEQRTNRSILLQLQRAVHSLKGGSRMLGLETVQAIAYQLENAFEQFALHHFSSNIYDNLLESAIVWLKEAIFKQNYQHFDGLQQSLENIQFIETAIQIPSKLTRTDLFSTEPVMSFVQGDGTEPPPMMGEWEQAQRLDQNNEMIRVSADLIEKMIDLSGENSINRSRIEMDLSQFGHTLAEMELAIQRLADQLRRMEGELETQIIAKHGIENSRYTEFDPLEMDQYSSLNQLSKSLAESASDLVDFKNTLSEKIRDTEGLLVQQSRIQAEIQEGLMRTRLVPFSRLLPRLQRIVRQTSTALNRPAELFVNNTEGELDRTMLERLVTPLEHMLRNAIDHGLEDRAQREQAQKPETGRIELNIHRQGTDVVVTFKDDGQGIDIEKVRQKALMSGLINAEQVLEHQDILQLIFHPGLSTADQVTQISGRGVGLDVVQSDIKALGGHVSVESVYGQGTVFTIRVPTTVAVSDALMVKVADQQFAIPLAQIDRIVRVSPASLEQYFGSAQEFFEFENKRYPLRYLSEFVGSQPIPRLSGMMYSLPVLMIKANNGQTVALLVDQLIGSRAQIVVKPIGQQFSSIGAIAGATILGDGQVCLILDGQNIARQIQSTRRLKLVNEAIYRQRESDERRLIMIVDDSVTVRKVTSRLLERQGYDVVTAKDGVDAIEQLENIKPDLMLLDIEMPRMDGFEVLNLVRHHDMHQYMPIIMITSRTGEKHRERAFSLGVSQYMGKPFQEEDLLHNIDALFMTFEGGLA